jgi:hypothetical protein
MNMWCLWRPSLRRGGEWLLTWLQTLLRSSNGCSLVDAHLQVPDYAELGTQSLHLVLCARGSGSLPAWDPTTSTELWCHAASSS